MSYSQMRMVWPRPIRRKPQNEDQVTFKKAKEFKLRDWIVEQITFKKTPCLFEMSFVFTCLKDNNFNEKECVEEVTNFRNCYADAIKKVEAIKIRRKSTNKKHFAANDKMTSSEINAMMSKYKK